MTTLTRKVPVWLIPLAALLLLATAPGIACATGGGEPADPAPPPAAEAAPEAGAEAAPDETAPEPYVPPTRDDVVGWLKAISLEELIDYVIVAETVRHAAPVIDPLALAVVLADRDVYLLPQGPLTFSLGPLSFAAEFAPIALPGLLPPPPAPPRSRWGRRLLGLLAAAAAGAGAWALLTR